MKKNHRNVSGGPAKAAHDEAAARKALERGLEALGLSRSELEERPRGASEKAVLA